MRFQSGMLMRILGIIFLFVMVLFPWIELYILLQADLVEKEGAWCLVLFVAVISTFSWLLVYCNFWEKCFAVLIITENCIMWKCPLKQTHRISVIESKYFGVQHEVSYNSLPYPFIYISKHPYPREFEGKINRIRCSNDFIKFWYSNELCDFLITKFPTNRIGPLQYYRQQLQRNK